jgi:AraC-like DNA-binding protein
MMEKGSRAGGAGLERLCPHDWVHSSEAEGGIELFEAWFQRGGYHKHRHDTYAICLTTSGIQAFNYRGCARISMPGQVVVLHPDEVHDGYAATEVGFGYRQLYLNPALIFEALQSISPRMRSLPFVRAPVMMSQKLSAAVISAFAGTREPLALEGVILQVAEGLIEADPSCTYVPHPRHLDAAAVNRAREYLDSQKARIVHSQELEAVTGLTRFDLARQFRAMCGTSPYRYLLMRRLDVTREQLTRGRGLAQVAIEAGFADQAHFSRLFKAAFGITPARYRALRASANYP